jgi:hypothetical protein
MYARYYIGAADAQAAEDAHSHTRLTDGSGIGGDEVVDYEPPGGFDPTLYCSHEAIKYLQKQQEFNTARRHYQDCLDNLDCARSDTKDVLADKMYEAAADLTFAMKDYEDCLSKH